MFNFIKHELRAFLNLLGELISGYFRLYIGSAVWALCIAAVLLPICCAIGTIPKWAFWLEVAVICVILICMRYRAYAKKEAEKTETEEE